MATLTVTQPVGEGISLKFVHAPNGGADAVSGTVFLATTSIDNQEFIYKDFVYTNNEATVVLSDADLKRVYTEALHNARDHTAEVTMSATAYNGATTVTQDTITGLATAKTLVHQSVPTTPTVSALQGQDGYISFNFSTVSATSPALVLQNGNVLCDIIVNSVTYGIQTFTVEAITQSTVGTTHTISARTADGTLVNATNYEAAIRVANVNGKSLFSDTQSIVPSNIPNSLTIPIADTYYSSGTTLDQTESGIAAVFGAKWLDSDADKGTSVVVRFGVVDGNNEFNENTSVQQGTVTLTAANFTTNATSIPNCNVRNAWFTTDQNGSDVTQLQIVARIEQTTDGIVQYSNLTAPLTVYKITLPTLSAITIESVNSAGLQTFNTASGGTLVDDRNVAGTLTATYNASDSNIAITTNNNSATAMDADFTLDYATIDAGSNGNLVFTLSLPDANGTQQLGSLVQYTASSTQALHAFKDPEAPIPSITGGAVTIAPTIEVTTEGDNFGYILDDYDIVIFDQLVTTYKPYIATADGSSRQADSTGTSYIVADYKVSYTKNLSGIPADYDGKYTSPTIIGTSAGTALYFINPTITDVSIAGADMTIVGNTGGATFAAGAITSLGFTAGTSANDFDISTQTANMPATSTGNLAAYGFTVTVTHAQGALVLDRNNAATGGQFDGFGFVNSSNANSALSILNV